MDTHPMIPEKLQFSLLWTCPQPLILWTTLLHYTFGLSGYVIFWIWSYLTDRSTFVKIDSSSSPSTTIHIGVPQGSVLGPLLFVFFISPLANVIHSDQSNQNGIVSFHQYADDTQLYIDTNSSTLTSQIASIESCSRRVHDWLLINGLPLNPSKSEAIAFYKPRSKPLAALTESIGTVSVAGSPIRLQSSIDNLGVYLDLTMSFDKQVSETCKACYSVNNSCFSHYWGFQNNSFSNSWLPTWFLQFSPGWHIRIKFGSTSACLEHSCSSCRTKTRYCHITPVLSDLHWLPVRYKITFKFATVTYRVLQFQQPSYLASLIMRYVPERALRSSSSLSICVPTRKTTMAASKSFSSVVSGIWNALPICCPSQLFLFSDELSNIIYPCLLTLTVVQNLVW